MDEQNNLENSLKQIHWKDGKCVDDEGNKVNPKMIGEPFVIPLEITGPEEASRRLEIKILEKKKYFPEANAYLLGFSTTAHVIVPDPLRHEEMNINYKPLMFCRI